MQDQVNASLYVLITPNLEFKRGRRVSGTQQIRHNRLTYCQNGLLFIISKPDRGED